MTLEAFAQNKELAKKAQSWADKLRFGPLGKLETRTLFGARFGVSGVGMLQRDSREFLVFFMSTPRSKVVPLDKAPLLRLKEDGNLIEAMKIAWPNEEIPDEDGRIIRMPRVFQQAAAGSRVAGISLGTVGPAAKSTGSNGFLTAGHVVGSGGNVKDASGKVIGTIRQSFDPKALTSASNVDVAYVEMKTPAATTVCTLGSRLTSSSSSIQVILNSGTTSASVVSKAAWYLISGACYNDVYLTGKACTSPGDSGALAAVSRGAVGLVVGGASGVSTFIQDIHTQLAAFKLPVRL